MEWGVYIYVRIDSSNNIYTQERKRCEDWTKIQYKGADIGIGTGSYALVPMMEPETVLVLLKWSKGARIELPRLSGTGIRAGMGCPESFGSEEFMLTQARFEHWGSLDISSNFNFQQWDLC